jgi:hypothetical protein
VLGMGLFIVLTYVESLVGLRTTCIQQMSLCMSYLFLESVFLRSVNVIYYHTVFYQKGRCRKKNEYVRVFICIH